MESKNTKPSAKQTAQVSKLGTALNQPEVKTNEQVPLVVYPVPTVEPVAGEKHSSEELLKRIKELENKLNNQPQTLEDRLKLYQEKQKQMEQLARIDEQIEGIQQHQEVLFEECATDWFETKTYNLVFNDLNKYQSDRPIFTISHTQTLAETLDFVLSKLQNKRKALIELIEN